MPFLGWCVLLTNLTDLVRKLLLEFRVSDEEVVEELFDDSLDVLRVRDLVE